MVRVTARLPGLSARGVHFRSVVRGRRSRTAARLSEAGSPAASRALHTPHVLHNHRLGLAQLLGRAELKELGSVVCLDTFGIAPPPRRSPVSGASLVQPGRPQAISAAPIRTIRHPESTPGVRPRLLALLPPDAPEHSRRPLLGHRRDATVPPPCRSCLGPHRRPLPCRTRSTWSWHRSSR